MKLKVIALVGVGGLLTAAAAGAQLMRSGYEGPSYDVLQTDGKFEVRAYESRIVAETAVSSSDWQKSTSTGFSRLAGYIFGGNKTESGQSTKIAMTSPVESVPGTDSEYTVVFTMPSDYQLEDLPAPTDERVTLRRVPPTTVATLTFSGVARRQDIDALSAQLLRRVEDAGFVAESAIKIAQYDPPWVIGPLRKNELMVDVAPKTTH